MKYSVIIPVFNRPSEVKELLQSLEKQTFSDFEVVIVEDGSTEPCKNVVDEFSKAISFQYFYKENTGPGLSRNYGMDRARGDYFIFFDSDCLIPADYFEILESYLSKQPLDVFGGADNEHPSFSTIQKAINYAMTSFLTTGGIRGRKKQIGKFQPRSFNMGLSKEVYKQVGGFTTLHPGEDPDLSIRIKNAGFRSGLVPDLFVYHKRRIDFKKFAKQVYKFGVVRNILFKWHPGTFSLVFFLPSIFLIGTALLILLGIFTKWWFFIPLILLIFLLFGDALGKTKSMSISWLAIMASFIQLFGYGWGFLEGFVKIHILKQDERKVFANFFF